MPSLKLYTIDPAAATPAKIDAVLTAVNLDRGTLKVSRTVGPENWFALNKRMFAGEDDGDLFPPTDIDNAVYPSTRGVAALSRAQSVLTISFAGAKSKRLSALNRALQANVPPEIQGFFISSARLSFGPTDIVTPIEDDQGQADVELVDVAHFTFSLSCDRFRGCHDLFADAASAVPEFAQYRRDLERVVGPMKLYFQA